MRVATYNVHDCIGRDGRHDPARITAILAGLDADLIALQEVTLDTAGELVERFESATALRAIEGSLFERGVGRYGNLVLTRDRVAEARLHDLSFRGREPRGCIEVAVEQDGVKVRVFATHLGLRRAERRSQLARIGESASAAGEACIVLGDLNTWTHTAGLKRLAEQGFAQLPVRSFPTHPWPVAALDRILARPPAVLKRCWRYDSAAARQASDHFPVLADLRLA